MNTYKIEVICHKDGKIKSKELYFVDAESEKEAVEKLEAAMKHSSEVPAGCTVEVRVAK